MAKKSTNSGTVGAVSTGGRWTTVAVNRLTDWHSHAHGQLIYMDAGYLHIRTELGAWLLPPARAVWIPPNVKHCADLRGTTRWSTVLVPIGRCSPLSCHARVLAVSPLLKALVGRVSQFDSHVASEPEEKRMLSVLIDEIRVAAAEPLHLPMPSDKRLQNMLTILQRDPGQETNLDALATTVGLSVRTARRLISTSLGMTLSEWRQQARLIKAVEMLAVGHQVSVVADSLGYSSPSNFIAMFRQALGVTPGRYLHTPIAEEARTT